MNRPDLFEEMESMQIEYDQLLVVEQAISILNQEVSSERSIATRIDSGSSEFQENFPISKLDHSRMFHSQTIEKICVKYRMRFLESTLFKGEIPVEAVREIKHLEQQLGITLEKFKVIAPSERFKLKDSTKDPVLLAELPNGRYYYIFQWGDDMKWYEHLLKYPFRHMRALAISSIIVGLLLAVIVPSQFELLKAEFFYRFFIFSMTSCLVLTLAIITGIMHSKDFSENVWNSKFIR
jgi:hypothetical protein